MSKCKFTVILLCLLAVVLLGILGLRTFFKKLEQDMTNMEISNVGEITESISFEEAVILQAACASIDQGTAQAQLLELEKEILAETGKDTQYYRFVGTFSFTGLENTQGQLTSLIVAADDSETCIYSACDPLVELLTESNRITWRDGHSYNAVSADKRSVRLAAVGYVGIELRNNGGYPELLSNTLHPTFYASF